MAETKQITCPANNRWHKILPADSWLSTRAKWDEVYQWATNQGYSFSFLTPGKRRIINRKQPTAQIMIRNIVVGNCVEFTTSPGIDQLPFRQ